MKSYHINMGAGLEGLVVREQDVPVPGSREVLVRVRACSLNSRELLILLLGYYPLPVRPDVIPVSDGAGEVVAIGEGVKRVKVGDRVAGVVFPRWIDGPFQAEVADQLGGSLDGMLTEYALLSEDGVVPIPDHLSFEEAAALPCAALTAWNALTGGMGLQVGDSVLTLGSGGVSLFALQLAKIAGARVIATTSRAEKAERLKALGADHVINYHTTPDWHLAVRELTGGRGVDHVVEVGGPGTIVKSINATRISGEIAVIGSVARDNTDDRGIHRAVFMGTATLRGISLGSRAQFLAMNRAIAANGMRPVIDRMFPFAEAKAAYQYYSEVQPFGKVIISLG
ncbi:NADPH:quinone oxidoreductase [Ktedonobacter sp. SOSP1-85]|uniref:zinc-dependent alcohol dehydrogenase family protein n=1 Tax=Ktedonobacter sp. SOSP1-85 TaxID=2778367 RepID=UPI0019161DA6|nr:NAD(P)-dependent alcohol dehydrogenase [Ktedonobacter sp. SOSP1-85]GHO80370.1 NADPH:quinone oxidoreductase [Ktedonobacter sp. SOSP1-85]